MGSKWREPLPTIWVIIEMREIARFGPNKVHTETVYKGWRQKKTSPGPALLGGVVGNGRSRTRSTATRHPPDSSGRFAWHGDARKVVSMASP